jgi:D-alanyl-D-alanine carboxypeptidase
MWERERFEREVQDLSSERETADDAYAALSSSRLAWKGASPEQLEFMRRAYDAQVERYRHAGRLRFFDTPRDQLDEIELGQLLHRDILPDCRALLADARRQLAEAQARGDADALSTKSFGVGNGYRSASEQFDLWQRYFPRYYADTRARRLKAKGGEHGQEAADIAAEYISGWLSPPGFGNHVQGRAIDVFAKMSTYRLGASSAHIAAWKQSWLHRWLVNNAGRHNFVAYAKEPWHWDHVSAKSVQPSKAPARASGSRNGSWSDAAAAAASGATKAATLAWALATGERDENNLTDIVFRGRHPELAGRALTARDRGLAQEWRSIRDGIVRPFLANLAAQGRQQELPQAGLNQPSRPLGNLRRDVWTPPGSRRRAALSYRFTDADALWLARLLVGEAGGRNDADNQAVVWTLFNRYALFTHAVYPTFAQFIRAYSTVLQPVLRSWGAAQRHYRSAEFVRDPSGATYAHRGHPEIPQGQLRRHLELQARPWARLPEGARRLALEAMSGRISSPVGLASEFASTFIYYRQAHNSQRPSDEQWRDFTERFARGKKWVWVGDRPGLDQKKNAFFIDARAAALPEGTVRVEPV